jgi:CheY-like chemotaxis protein
MALIAISGYGQTADRRRALEAGFDAHLTKPVTPERLQQTIGGLAER